LKLYSCENFLEFALDDATVSLSFGISKQLANDQGPFYHLHLLIKSDMKVDDSFCFFKYYMNHYLFA